MNTVWIFRSVGIELILRDIIHLWHGYEGDMKIYTPEENHNFLFALSHELSIAYYVT